MNSALRKLKGVRPRTVILAAVFAIFALVVVGEATSAQRAAHATPTIYGPSNIDTWNKYQTARTVESRKGGLVNARYMKGLPSVRWFSKNPTAVARLHKSWRIFRQRKYPTPTLVRVIWEHGDNHGKLLRLTPPNIKNVKIVRKVFKAHGLNPVGGIAVALRESHLNPGAIGDNGCSYGTFQANWCVHGLDVKRNGLDPVWNASRAARGVRTCEDAPTLNKADARSVAYVLTRCYENPAFEESKARLDVLRVGMAEKILAKIPE